MAQLIDMSLITRLRNPRGRSFLGGLRPGSDVGLQVAGGDCYVMSNGRVVAIEGDSVYAEFPRITQHPSRFRLLQDVNTGHALNQGAALRKGTLKRGAHIHVIEVYAAKGLSCMVSGQITALIADAFKVGDHWFDYGSTQDGTRRTITAIGGR